MSATSPNFHQRIAASMADAHVIRAVHEATLHKIDAVAVALAELRNHQGLRDLAACIKQHTLENLPQYIEQFTAACERNGTRVHFAADAQAAQQIICAIARDAGSKLAVKSKSMATEEIRLNDALVAAGVPTVETDLGEFIVQIDGDRPSHIVTPIIHKDRRQVARAMAREIGCEYTEDPEELTKIARAHLRDIFRRCDLGITGANFAIAESGSICVCTNEGNGRMTTTRPRVHVALVGMEKLIPRVRDLPVFLKLLARSSTGQPLTVYTTLVTGPRRPGDRDGPEQVHIVLLDNGRSNILGGPLQEVLRCIRCGACLNACPVFRNIGGHAYGDVYPGPIGSLVTPLLNGLNEYAELPRASSLCGACQVACPVKIDLPGLLVKLRVETRARQPLGKRLGMSFWKRMMQSSAVYGRSQRLMHSFLRGESDGWITRGVGPLGQWTKARDLPPPPKTSFRDRWRQGLGSKQLSGSPARVSINRETSETSEKHAGSISENAAATTRTALHDDPATVAREVRLDEDLAKRFEQKASAVGMSVHAATPTDWPGVIGELLQRHDVQSVALPTAFDGFLDAQRVGQVKQQLAARGITATSDTSDEVLFSVDAGITGVAAAIAEHGSLVCASQPTIARGSSLIPPVHIAVVAATQLLPDLCDYFASLSARATLPAALSLITGPSKTADIEGVLVTGVHGPGAVHIVLVRDA